MAGNGFLVELSVAVALFYLVAGVAKVDVVAFLTAQVLLAGGLDTGIACGRQPAVGLVYHVHERAARGVAVAQRTRVIGRAVVHQNQFVVIVILP